MPACHLDKKSLQKLYEEFSRENDLAEALMRKPEYVIAIRLSMGKSQTAFENFLGMSKNLYKYESGRIKPKQKTAEKFLSSFRALAPWETVWKNYEQLSSESRGWFAANAKTAKATSAQRKGAENHMKIRGLTSQESEVAQWLASRGFGYKANSKVGGCYADFYIKKLNLALECKRLETHNRREQMKMVKLAAYQGYKMRFHDKDVKLAVVFESKLGLSAAEKEELCGPYNYIFEKVAELDNITKDQAG